MGGTALVSVVLAFLGVFRRKQIFGSMVYGVVISSLVSLVKWPFSGYFGFSLLMKILTVFVLIGLGLAKLDDTLLKKEKKERSH